MPRSTSAKNHRSVYDAITPTDRVRPVTRAAASGEAVYSSCWAALNTRSRVDVETLGRPRKARDTVATETPASRATSTMLALTGATAVRGSIPPDNLKTPDPRRWDTRRATVTC